MGEIKENFLLRCLSPAKVLFSIDCLSQYLPPRLIWNFFLRWIAQKDLLQQDIFLIGPPGPLRRRIALRYAELTNREVEYLAITRDVTESDIKQRREILDNKTVYIDQAAVRAALNGRLLIVEGVEKAERNILPVLNNLLENREMQLDDGRFLVSPSRFDNLLKSHSLVSLRYFPLISSYY